MHTGNRWIEIGSRKVFAPDDRGRVRRRLLIEERRVDERGMVLPRRYGVRFVRFADSQRFRRD